jgi:hypothetical protein
MVTPLGPPCDAVAVQKLVVVAAMVAGVVGLAGYLQGWNTGNTDLMQTAGPLVVAALALLGVAAGLKTWRDERLKAREVQQRDSYARLIEGTFSRFAGGQFDAAGEAKLRADVVTWADPKVVRALADWNRAFDDIATEDVQGVAVLTPEQQQRMREAMAAMVYAVREELRIDPGATRGDVEKALFNTLP